MGLRSEEEVETKRLIYVMNEILNKLGIYDLVAVLLSGICITTFSLLADQVFFESRLADSLKVEDTFLFMVISYFVGLVFQEASSVIQKNITHRNNKLLMQALDTSVTSHQLLTKKEKDGIFQAVQTELAMEEPPNETILYNYCKFYLFSSKNTARADRDQSTLGMSRSLSLYFFGMFFAVMYSIVPLRTKIKYF